MYMFPVAGRDDDPELFLFQRHLHLPLQEEGLPVGVHGEGHVALDQDAPAGAQADSPCLCVRPI